MDDDHDGQRRLFSELSQRMARCRERERLEGERKRINWRTVALLLVAVPVLYVASAGPVIWLVQRGYIPQSTATLLGQTVYAPLGWCVEHSETAMELWGHFIDFWASLGDPFQGIQCAEKQPAAQ